MELNFSKYHGAGNDFILVNNLDAEVHLSTQQIHDLCHRRFGIGADGLMLLNSHSEYDFEMKYYNSDGREGTMCGNGGRCIVAYAARCGVIHGKTRFIASDGPHDAEVTVLDDALFQVKLQMQDVDSLVEKEGGFFLDTGSPHYVEFVQDLANMDVVTTGRDIRHSAAFAPDGANVNFVENQDEGLFVRTFERGVEDETWACGTGVTASALAFAHQQKLDRGVLAIRVLGGQLKVFFKKEKLSFEDIWLEGPAQFVFEGKTIIQEG